MCDVNYKLLNRAAKIINKFPPSTKLARYAAIVRIAMSKQNNYSLTHRGAFAYINERLDTPLPFTLANYRNLCYRLPADVPCEKTFVNEDMRDAVMVNEIIDACSYFRTMNVGTAVKSLKKEIKTFRKKGGKPAEMRKLLKDMGFFVPRRTLFTV